MGLTPAAGKSQVSYDPPSQEGWVTTRLEFLVNWGRANSLWPMPFGTACCAIEFMPPRPVASIWRASAWSA